MNTKNMGIRRILAVVLTIAIVATTVLAITAFAVDKPASVSLIDGNSSTQVSTNASTVADFLEERNIVLAKGESVSPSAKTSISPGMNIILKRSRNVIVSCDGTTKSFVTNETVTKDYLVSLGYIFSEEDYFKQHTDNETGDLYVDIIRVAYETITDNVEIESTEILIYTDKMFQGESNVKKEGKNGLSEITYNVRYENGVEVSKVQLSYNVIELAVDSVKEVGTKSRNPESRQVQSAVIDETSGVIYTSSGQELHYSRIIDVTATAYSPASCGKAPSHPAYGITATGIRATYGVIAVDPRVIPLGSKVYITAPDGSWTYGTAVAADTGGAIKGNIIDLCYDTNAECFQFGRRYARVYILS